ncbi:MAG TPA: cytochrome b/b6 domain-containing protein [Spirochaetota bacterium]|nr:cytochrome b/b6 domain-containing protein [Spirochaetota bacterium]
MRKYIIIFAALSAAVLAVYTGITAPAKKIPCPKCYVMHPDILPLDKAGNRTGIAAMISQERTCGECHNARFINGHNSHYNDKVKIGCSECHVEGGVISLSPGSFNPDGRINKDILKIRVPSDENCLKCHGVGSVKGKEVFIPDDFPGVQEFLEGGKCFRVTCRTGEILSPENISGSLINIKDKDKLNFPWDVHMQREVACVSCHFTRNDPRRAETRKSDQDHLANDPRKSYSIGKYLYIPDHNLVHADCRTCHTPEKKHDFLPYKKRHFAVLSCQSCHVPRLYGPALRSVDETVVTVNGTPRYEYRARREADYKNLNTAYTEGYVPFLLSHTEEKPGAEEIYGVKNGISPVNLILRWSWIDADGKAVQYETVRRAYMDGKTFNTDVVKVFDADKDGIVDDNEIMLETIQKTEFIKNRLEGLGVKHPFIRGVTESYRINHGIADEKSIREDCLSCHSGRSRFNDDVELASFVPAGALFAGTNDTVNMNGLSFHLDGEIEGKEKLKLVKDGSISNRYILGYSSYAWLNVLGFLIFILSAAGAAGHGIIRHMANKSLPHREVKLVTRIIYPVYERIWHWGMAFSVIMLIVTGLEIHFAGSFTLFGFDNTVDIHNGFALIVAVNAGLSLFYHLATGEIRQYFSIKRGFRSDAIVQVVYYVYGIFRNSRHPFEKSTEKKLNPLQQITYVILLNILFPVQIVTGIMMWIVSVSPAFSSAVDGLTIIAPVHNFFAWLFIAFLAVHLYLVPTGHNVFSNLKAMITGREEIEESSGTDDARAELSGIKIADIIANIKKITGGGKA